MSGHPYTRGYFEGDGTGYLGLYRDFVTHWRMIKAIKEKQPTSVLDVAGARGYICKHLEAELGIRAVCMDISDHCFHTRATDDFALHDVRKAPWPFKDKEFDLAISMAFMEHLTEEEIPTVTKEMARVSNRAYLTITFEKTPQDTDRTHRTFQSREAWLAKFKEYAPDYPVEIMSVEEAKKMEQIPIELPQPDGLVKMNIGSFQDMFYYGWENIDSQDLSQFALQNGYTFKQCDMRRGIQKPDNSVDCLLASHFIEHLTREEGDAFLKEFYRVLKPKGILRLAIPDTRLLIEKYLDGSIMEFRHINVGVEKAPDMAEALFHLLIAGHQTMYDLPSLTTKLKKNGNWKIQKMTAFESQSEAIKKQTVPNFCTLSIYIEAKKVADQKITKPVNQPTSAHKDKLKIALISTPMLKVFPTNYGGLESVCGDLCEALAQMGHSVTVFAPNGSKVEGCRVIECGEELNRVNVDWLNAEKTMWEKYKDTLQDFDIICGMNWFGFEYASKALNKNLKVCHVHHGGISDFWRRSPPPFKLNMIAISDFMVKVYASQGFTARRVYNGINLEKYKFQRKKGNRLLFLGRISKIKAPHVAIEVAKKANMDLDVVGATNFVDDPSYVTHVKSLCDGEQIKFIGEVSHAVKLNYLQNAKALIVPSCVPQGFDVLTESGLKDVALIKVGDRVYGHDGKFHVVTKTFQREFQGDLVEIVPCNRALPIRVTPEHPIYVFRDGKPCWIRAFEIKDSDYLVIPTFSCIIDMPKLKISDYVPNTEVLGEFIFQSKAYAYGNYLQGYKIPDIVAIDRCFLRVAGYYIAEGCIRNGGVEFNFGPKEKAFADEVAQSMYAIFNIHAAQRLHHNSLSVMCNSVILQKLFALFFGVKANKKRLPSWIMNLTPEKLVPFIQAIWLGDGCKTHNNEYMHFEYRTASKTLAVQLWFLLAKMGIIPNLHVKVQSTSAFGAGHKIYDLLVLGRYVAPFAKLLGVAVDGKTRRIMWGKAKQFGNDIIVPIYKIGKIPHNGRVFNLEVDNSNSYLCEGAMLHNCWGEPFGLHVVESLCCGSPVITFADGAIPEIVKEGGIICADMDAMVDSVKQVSRISPKDCRRNAERFDRKVMAKSYVQLYQSILGGDEW